LKGGAERSYFDTAEVLAKNGHDLAFFSMKHPKNRPSRWSKYFIDEIDYNDDSMSFWEKLKAGFKIIYNVQARKNLEKLIEDFKPDIVHLHNTYHQLSPSIIMALKKYRIPMVMTLHDYKLISPSYNLYVRGQIWEKSKDHKYYRCFTNKCVKNSYLKSAISALEAYFLKFSEIYYNIDLFISPSQFLIKKFREFGFRKDIIHLPNPLMDDLVIAPEKTQGVGDYRYFLYYGRLGEEKGIKDLIQAFISVKNKIKLVVAGTGPQEKELIEIVKMNGLESDVLFVGFQEGEALWGLVEAAEFIVVPSNCYENSPYTVLEAMSLQKAVISSDIGGLPEMIEHGKNGLLYKYKDIEKLSQIIDFMIAHPGISREMGQQAQKTIIEKHSKDYYYKTLIKIYEFVIAKN
jgi:glycosyltransferase involved in cell wall biosynthesis